MAWTGSRTVTFDHTKVPSAQTNFPIVVIGSYGFLKSVGNGGEVTSASGFDIVFATDALGVTILDFERVSWSATSGAIEFWVKVPSLSSSVDTVIYLLSGNSAVTADQSNPTAVWSSYAAVYHLPDGTTLTSNDSTGVNNATQHNSPVAVSAQVDGGANFPTGGSGPYLDAGDNASIQNLATGNVTFEFWIRWDADNAPSFPVAIDKGNWAFAADRGFIVRPTQDSNGDNPRIELDVLRPYPNTARWAAVIPILTWTHVIITYNGGFGSTDALLYINGSLATTIDFNAGSGSVGSDVGFDLVIGGDPGYGSSFMSGMLDEVRISRSIQTASYAATTYNNQIDPSRFYTIEGVLPNPRLSLVKVVSGGIAVTTSWTLSASGPTPISGAGGITSDVAAGPYTLSENSIPNYVASAWVCVGGSQSGDVVTISDGQSVTCTITNTFFQAPPVSVSCPLPPGNVGEIGVLFSAQIIVSGGEPPFTFILIGGSLPPGLTLDSSTGIISGTPTVIGTFTYTIRIGNSSDAVITLFPVQVGIEPGFRQPGGTNFSGINPFYFRVGDQLYQSLANSQFTDDTLDRWGIFKRAVADINGPWVQMDSVNSPGSDGTQSGEGQSLYDPITNKIYILYISRTSPSDHSFAGVKICAFDIATDTWESPSALLGYFVFGSQFVFCLRTDGTFVVVGTTSSAHPFYATYNGSWSSTTSLGSFPCQFFGGVIDSTNTIHCLINDTGSQLDYRQLSSSFVLSAHTVISNNIPFSEGGIPTIILWGSSSIAIGYITGSDTRVSIGTPLAAPIFTDYLVATSLYGNGYSTVAQGIGGDLNNFYIETDPNASPDPIDRIMQSTFDGVSTWSTPIVFYDEIANPPVNPPPLVFEEFLHTLDAIELPQGWTVATTLETVDPNDPEFFWCTGFSLDQATLTCAISILQGCEKFKLYANSRIEFIGFGEDQIKAFNLMPINQQMLLPVAKPRLGKWNLANVRQMRSGGQGDLL